MKKIKKITIADNEPFLRQISKPVIFPDSELIDDIKNIEEYLSTSDITLALASVQLGIPKRLIYLRNTNLERLNSTGKSKGYNEARVLINPVIISREGLTDFWEACDSCLDYFGHVKRPYRIAVEYQDINGDKHTEVFEGFESTVLSHEIDHLDGILHIDIATEILVMNYDERINFRKTHGYNIVSKTGKFEDLVKGVKTEKTIY